MLLIHFGQKNLVVHTKAELLFCFMDIAEIEDVINKTTPKIQVFSIIQLYWIQLFLVKKKIIRCVTSYENGCFEVDQR